MFVQICFSLLFFYAFFAYADAFLDTNDLINQLDQLFSNINVSSTAGCGCSDLHALGGQTSLNRLFDIGSNIYTDLPDLATLSFPESDQVIFPYHGSLPDPLPAFNEFEH